MWTGDSENRAKEMHILKKGEKTVNHKTEEYICIKVVLFHRTEDEMDICLYV
jgi:hypothetical protein